MYVSLNSMAVANLNPFVDQAISLMDDGGTGSTYVKPGVYIRKQPFAELEWTSIQIQHPSRIWP